MWSLGRLWSWERCGLERDVVFETVVVLRETWSSARRGLDRDMFFETVVTLRETERDVVLREMWS